MQEIESPRNTRLAVHRLSRTYPAAAIRQGRSGSWGHRPTTTVIRRANEFLNVPSGQRARAINVHDTANRMFICQIRRLRVGWRTRRIPYDTAATIEPTTIDVPGSSSTRAYGINKAGDIVGTYVVSRPVGVNSYGFLLTKGRFTTIDFPGGFGTEAHGINAAGEIVGVYWDNQGAALGRHGFLLSGGRFTRIGGPHAVVTRALGINDSGQIVGVYTVRGPSGIPGSEAGGLLSRLLRHPYPYDYEYGHGFVYDNGRFTNIDFPGAARGEQTMATAINAADQVVGSYLDRNYVTHGFMLMRGNYINVMSPVPGRPIPRG